ncbi:hypothetical protein WN944_010423 [Citrus x changshan-huyou]|uniref:DUF4283 domain-containing protein n=1 Tax=Citrus x changshan-huyou TaxID=2935761 RepID=A0AAP0MXX1_9ROSI
MQRKHAQLQVTKPRRSARGMIPNILRRKPNPENSHKEIKINSKRKCNFHKLLEPNLASCDDSEPNLAVANPARPESCLACLRLAGQRNCGRRKAEGSRSSSGGTAREEEYIGVGEVLSSQLLILKMDTEKLIRRCKEISLSGKTRGKVSFKGNLRLKGEKIVAGCLMGKVLHNKKVNLEGLRLAMSQVWRTVREVRIEELGDNIFMFKFATEADKRRILAGGPWHFNRALMVLIEPTSIRELTKLSFSHVSFWIQIHNVPIMCMNEETIRDFGKEIGKVEEVGTNAAGECIGKYARLRVPVDVTKPLVKVLSLEPEEDGEEGVDMENEDIEAEKKEEKRQEIVMLVLYEKLLNFCYVYGCVGHQFRECIQFKNQSRDEMAYGPWLKAPTNAEKIKLNKGKERGKIDEDNQRRNMPFESRV